MTTRSMRCDDTPLWRPEAGQAAGSQMAAFMRQMGCADYAALHAWSISAPEHFWREVWRAGDVIGEPGNVVLQNADSMPGARWFPEARLNFAENLLRDVGNADALVFRSEDRVERRLSRTELRQQVAQMAAAFRTSGVQPGDRVAACLPNMPETLIAMLAAASIGAVFSSASPDFGVQGVLDRFGQISPVVLLACDGYHYNGKPVDVRARLTDIMAGLPSVRCMVLVPCLGEASGVSLERCLTLAEFLAPHRFAREPDFLRLPFDHPLCIMYSSGTTGAPKCIVHGAGGTLLQHLKEHRLHCDVRDGDRLFYYTTCGWMMWNWLASALASGATLLLYDGSPFLHHGRVLWEYAEAERCTHFGTSARYLDALAKIDLKPRTQFDLAALRVVLSTGSPLVAEGFDFVHEAISPTAQISSISGGTDILGCFVLGSPTLPVWRGEIQCAGLGMAVDVWSEAGRPLAGEKGELVCTQPFPSMPIGFFGDDDGSRYRAAYFERFPGVWCHGDYCERTAHDGFVIHGRSDATLNPGGVRIGTAEIYRQVAQLPEVMESVAVGQDWQGDVRVVLFVRLREGLLLDEALAQRIRQTIRDNTTLRHVPAKILQVADIPRTRSGKLVELAVRRVLHGEPVNNIEALANPEALELFRERVELRD